MLAPPKVVTISVDDCFKARVLATIVQRQYGLADVSTNSSGQVIETMSLDPWGQRRDAETGEQLMKVDDRQWDDDRKSKRCRGV